MARRAQSPSSAALRAVVQAAPAAPRAPLTVRLAGDPADVVTTVEHWSPRGALLPQPGDRCLVSPDDEGHLWVAEWVPEADAEPQPDESVEVGAVLAFAIAPSSKWLPCDGGGVTSAHAALRSGLIASGSPYGTAGSDPRVPDLRGRTAIGAGNGSGLTARVAGQQVGTERHLLTSAESGLRAHSHVVPGPSGGSGSFAGGSLQLYVPPWLAGAGGTTQAVAALNASQEHPNMQPSLVVPYYIRAVA